MKAIADCVESPTLREAEEGEEDEDRYWCEDEVVHGDLTQYQEGLSPREEPLKHHVPKVECCRGISRRQRWLDSTWGTNDRCEECDSDNTLPFE